MLLGSGELLKSEKPNWNFASESESHFDDRRIVHPRSKVLEESSSINGMVHTRSHELDYETWANDFGCNGRGFVDVLPYFRLAESSARGASNYLGAEGPPKT